MDDDELNAILAESGEVEANDKPTKKEDSMKVIKIDGVDYEAEPKVIETLVAFQTRADSAEAQVAALQASNDEITAKLDSANDLVADIQIKLDSAVAPEAIEALVSSRILLLDSAKRFGVEVKADSAELDIKKSVIAKAFPKADLADKSEVYIGARFDAACEVLDAAPQVSSQGAAVVSAEVHQDGAAPVVSANDARTRMMKQQQSAYSTKE